MGPITRLIPVPRRLPLGGRDYLVSEMTLRDLAELQGHLDDRHPDALDAVEGRLAGVTDPADRERLLARAYRAEWDGPPAYGEPAAVAFYATDEGICLLAWTALRRHQPGLTPAAAVAIADAMTAAEYGRLWRTFHGVDTLEALERLLWGPREPAGGPPVEWTKVVVGVCERFPAYTLAAVYDLTLTELGALRRGGDEPERGRVLRPGEDPEVALAEYHRLFGGNGQ